MDKTEEMKLAREPIVRIGRGVLATALVVAIAACGGGKDGADAGSGDPGSGSPTPPVVATDAPTKTQASRFLAQATMGPTAAEIDRLSTMSYATWFDEQFAKAQTLHRLYINQATADAAAVGGQVSEVNFFDSWWSQALASDDQLRQRAAFALSEIFVRRACSVRSSISQRARSASAAGRDRRSRAAWRRTTTCSPSARSATSAICSTASPTTR